MNKQCIKTLIEVGRQVGLEGEVNILDIMNQVNTVVQYVLMNRVCTVSQNCRVYHWLLVSQETAVYYNEQVIQYVLMNQSIVLSQGLIMSQVDVGVV